MDTRTSDNWQKKPGGWDSLNLNLLQSDDDYPEIFCERLSMGMLRDIVNINDRKKHQKGTVLCSFIDDYHLERFWNQPERYGHRWLDLKVGAVMTPDFSLYIGMPLPMMQWNTYRTRMLGNLWMEMGLKIIPTVTWADYRSFEFCFKGIRNGSCVAISDIGIRSVQERNAFDAGYKKMHEEIRPSQILFMCQEKTRHLYEDHKVLFIDSFFSKRKQIWAAEEKTSKKANDKDFSASHLERPDQNNRLPNRHHRKLPLNRVDK